MTSLRAFFEEQSVKWEPLIESLSEDQLIGVLQTAHTSGEPYEVNRGAAIAHVFNHATHHRWGH
jgi:uncharacterized damage-inducible protein DinB